jgi:hypothetical protein
MPRHQRRVPHCDRGRRERSAGGCLGHDAACVLKSLPLTGVALRVLVRAENIGDDRYTALDGPRARGRELARGVLVRSEPQDHI